MDTPSHETSHVYRAKVDTSGRVVLPADLRMRQHIKAGDEVVIVETAGELRLKTQEAAIKEARELFAELAPPEVILSEEVIRDRRKEARNE